MTHIYGTPRKSAATYVPKKPCKRGHLLRYVNGNHGCVECARLKERERHPRTYDPRRREGMTEEQVRIERDRARAYYYKHRERILKATTEKRRADPNWQAYQHKRKHEYKLRQKAKWREGTAEWKRVNWRHYCAMLMLRGAKVRAKNQGLAFNLTLSDCLIPELCPVFKVPLQVDRKRSGGDAWSPQLDRIIPSKGYVKGNVIVVSALANRIKNNATPTQIKQVAEFYARLMDDEPFQIIVEPSAEELQNDIIRRAKKLLEGATYE